MTQSQSTLNTLHLPRILCLHGGGVNAEIFELQCRTLIARLGSSLRLVFMQAPFLSDPHPSVVTVYGHLGPFRRWIRWIPEHPEIEPEAAAQEIRYQVLRAMEDDAGTGKWIGILGFSQGAKIAASVLWTQQRMMETVGEEAWTHFKFGVFMAGKAPLLMLDYRLEKPAHVEDPSNMSFEFEDWPKTNQGPHVLHIPTLHVHGLRDPGMAQHQVLLDKYCKTGTTKLVEWDGGHRIPIKTHDVDAVANRILELAEDALEGDALPN